MMAEQGFLIFILAAIRASREVYILDINPTTLLGVIPREFIETSPWSKKLDITIDNPWIIDDIAEFAERAARHRAKPKALVEKRDFPS